MAKALIDSLASDFDPSGYKDEYREELLDLIERKAKGESLVSTETEAGAQRRVSSTLQVSSCETDSRALATDNNADEINRLQDEIWAAFDKALAR